MTHYDNWTKGRVKVREEKIKSLDYLLKKVTKKEDRERLEELKALYLDSHDLTTRIGCEITIIADQYR